MNIIVGTLNPAKIEAVKKTFSFANVKAVDAPSGVSSQPFSDQETLVGAKNRAIFAAASFNHSQENIGIGLEGGVLAYGDQLFLCNWGALVDYSGNTYLASGARIPLPKEIASQLGKGYELGEIMENYAKKKDVSKKEGAIGIFTNQYISREEMFRHVVVLLKGQYEFYH